MPQARLFRQLCLVLIIAALVVAALYGYWRALAVVIVLAVGGWVYDVVNELRIIRRERL
jgi:Flp pilus assembly protein TadB